MNESQNPLWEVTGNRGAGGAIEIGEVGTNRLVAEAYSEQDARLIAAAPELVAALEACVDPDDCSWDHNGNCQAHYDFDKPHECYNAVARALLARVRGEEKQG